MEFTIIKPSNIYGACKRNKNAVTDQKADTKKNMFS